MPVSPLCLAPPRDYNRKAMPKVFSVGGTRIVIYPNDHPPPHVHAVNPGGTARFGLNCPDGPVEVMDAMGFRLSTLDRLGEEIAARLGDCCAVWSLMHG